MTTDRRCPRCLGLVEPIFAKGRHAVWDGSRLWECPTCATAWPERELAPGPGRVFYEPTADEEDDDD